MTREIKSADEIRAWVQDRVDKIPGLAGGGGSLKMARPTWHEPDHGGCNWEITHYRGGAISYFGAMMEIINEARSKFSILEPE